MIRSLTFAYVLLVWSTAQSQTLQRTYSIPEAVVVPPIVAVQNLVKRSERDLPFFYVRSDGIDRFFARTSRPEQHQQFTLNPLGSQLGGYYSFGADNRRGFPAFRGNTKTSDLEDPARNNMATATAYLTAENDYAGPVRVAAYGVYTEGRATVHNRFTAGIESDCQNSTPAHAPFSSVFPTPGDIFGGAQIGVVCYDLWVHTHGTKPGTARFDTTGALGVTGESGAEGKGSRHKVGIIFSSNAIRPSASGHYEAVSLPQDYEFVWRNTAETAAGRLTSDGLALNWSGATLNIATPKTPASSTDRCATGDMSWDADFVYVCVAPNSWKRATLSSW